MEQLFSFDPAGDEPHVFVFARDGADGQWRPVPGPDVDYSKLIPQLPAAETHTWREDILMQTAEGWVKYESSGTFQLTEEQKATMRETFARLVREGKLTHHSTAGTMGEHLRRARL